VGERLDTTPHTNAPWNHSRDTQRNARNATDATTGRNDRFCPCVLALALAALDHTYNGPVESLCTVQDYQ